MIFENRVDAGLKLAKELQSYEGKQDGLVAGLARGGVILAHTVAKALHLSFDILLIKKIGAPGNEELALGAVAEEGEPVLNENLIALLGVSKEYILKESERQKELIKEKRKLYKKPSVSYSNKTVILIDDGIATGASMKRAIQVAKQKNAAKIVLAVPVAAPDTIEQLKNLVDEVICLFKPADFQAVGAFYKEFEQVSDQMIIDLK